MQAVVIGGGIVGLSSAYYLGERGVDVTVVERSAIGAGSTGRANGGIRTQFTSPEHVRLSQESVRVWDRFEAEFGVDIGRFRPGYLFLAREESTAARLRENVAVQREHGVPSEFLDPEAARDRCPGLRPGRFVGASFNRRDGFADPHLALQGYLRAAEAVGGDVRTGVEATGLVGGREAGRVTGVETADGRIDADVVVNAAGPWAARVAGWAGLDLPVTPRRRQLLVAEPERPVGTAVPMTVDLDGSVHFRPERDGAAVVGGHFAGSDPPVDPDGYRTSADFDWAATALDRAADVASYFGPESRFLRGWAGLYAVTPDHHPIVEKTVPGFVNAVGFSGHGFMHAPATGRVVAELATEGEASLVDVSRLGADRFERGETLVEGTVID